MSAPLRALEEAFHAMLAQSRNEPAPGLAERLDRLARLRAVVADNEERFRQAISADFGHRSAVEPKPCCCSPRSGMPQGT